MRLKNNPLEKNNHREEKLSYLKNRALNFLKLRPRTEKEIILFLKKITKKKNWVDVDLETVIRQLKDWGLINDKDFVAWFVSSRKKSHCKGKRLIVQELKQKGVSEKIIDDYFSQEGFDEDSLAHQLLKKYSYRWQDLPKDKKKEKMTRFLLSRGFSFETIRRALKTINIKQEGMI